MKGLIVSSTRKHDKEGSWALSENLAKLDNQFAEKRHVEKATWEELIGFFSAGAWIDLLATSSHHSSSPR